MTHPLDTTQDLTAGTFALGDLTVTRMGYGAMQLAGRGVFGPPRDRDEALQVLRRAVELGHSLEHLVSDVRGKVIRTHLDKRAFVGSPNRRSSVNSSAASPPTE